MYTASTGNRAYYSVKNCFQYTRALTNAHLLYPVLRLTDPSKIAIFFKMDSHKPHRTFSEPTTLRNMLIKSSITLECHQLRATIHPSECLNRTSYLDMRLSISYYSDSAHSERETRREISLQITVYVHVYENLIETKCTPKIMTREESYLSLRSN